MKASAALNYLAQTDVEYGRLRARCDGLEYRMKVTEAHGYLDAQGTQDERKSKSRVCDDYKNLVKEYIDTKLDLEIMAAKRKTAELTIEVWRSVNANRRKGNL